MLNITHYQRNANQNHNEVVSHLVRMAAIKKYINNKCWRGCEEKGTLLHCWWECKLVQPLWKTVWRYLKKLKIELPDDPAYGSSIKDRNGMDLKEAEDIKKRWQEYTEELYKKIFTTQIITME